MGHGDVLIIADAHFPGETIAKETTYGKLIRCPGTTASELFDAIGRLFPLDIAYTEKPACVMQLTEGDRIKGMEDPEIWGKFREILKKNYPEQDLGFIERMDFYDKAGKAYAVIETGEERIYGNLMLTKGCVTE